ncbi:MAG: ABC transporter permease [Paracoccaceae bacterium]
MSLGLPVVIFAALAVWLGGWWLNWRLSRSDHPAARAAIPVIFGLTLLALWEIVVRGFAVPQVILPGPSAIAAAIAANTGLLWADFWQTVVRSVLPGYAIGCGAGIAVALATDRSPFLQRGLLPIGTLAAALPIVGIAPIMVMWFGFDWQSKAAVAALMCFFPMLVNTIQGLRAADRAEAELLVTYAASYGQALRRLRWPAAMPFVFAGLKVCTTLALIGAIVAEFFGTPTVGIGFRISTGIGRLALDMVWAEIAVAALAGTAFYALVAAAERAVTFWHPSMRG